MPSLVNRLVIGELTKELAEAQGMLFLSFGGLTVKESEALRGKLASKGVRVRMVRNALARRVLAGNTAIAWGDSEAAVHAAKFATEPEVKKLGKVKIRAGVLDGALLTEKDAAALAGIPDRKTLQAKLLACLSGPARGLVATLNGLPSSLTRVVNARAGTLPPEASAPDAPADAPAPVTGGAASESAPEAPPAS